VSKERWLWLLLVVVALAGGILAGRGRGMKVAPQAGTGPTVTMLVLDSGEVHRAPANNDILYFYYQHTNPANVVWVGPTGTNVSPCTESNNPAGTQTCTVNYPEKGFKIYHYRCVDPNNNNARTCLDPQVPGPYSGGPILGAGLVQGAIVHRTIAPTGNVYAGQAGPKPDGTSGVYYFPSDGSQGHFNPIAVSAVNDQVVWEADGDAKWQVVLPAGACGESPTADYTISSSTPTVDTCTVLASADYCVIYGMGNASYTIGTAHITVPNLDPSKPAKPPLTTKTACKLP
jgi:hypothetical protein